MPTHLRKLKVKRRSIKIRVDVSGYSWRVVRLARGTILLKVDFQLGECYDINGCGGCGKHGNGDES